MTDQSGPERPRVNVRFLHAFCDDVAATREFYVDALGMTLQSTMDDDDFGWVVLQCDGFQLMFHRWDHGPLSKQEAWAWQPGDRAGDVPTISFGIEVPADDFRGVVGKLAEGHVAAITPVPTWRQGCYWGWTVRDPNGNTIEVYTMPEGEVEGDDPIWKA